MRICLFCKTPTEIANFCSWGCHVNEAKRQGGKVIAPNGLPIKCVKADGTMLEHEHADHPDYRFPVVIEYVGERDPGAYEEEYCPEVHALIYNDPYVAITLYEHCYSIWSLINGEPFFKGYNQGWRLTDEAITKIKKWRHIGSTVESFFEERGELEEVNEAARLQQLERENAELRERLSPYECYDCGEESSLCDCEESKEEA